MLQKWRHKKRKRNVHACFRKKQERSILQQKPKVIHTDNFGRIWESIVKNYHGIIEQLHLIDQRQAELHDELHVEQKKGHQPYYCNWDWMKNGNKIPRNAVAIFEMTKTSWQTGNSTKRWRIHVFLWQMVQQIYQEETTNSKNPLWDGDLP